MFGASETALQMDSILMIGQSNMAGRGDLGEVKPIRDLRCHMLRNGRWQPMCEPVNPDRAIFEGRYRSGISPAASFAHSYAKHFGRNVGLIPCADGGTAIREWMPGELLYDHAVMQTKLARRTARLRAILWHQGESDCLARETVEAYGERFLTLMTALRREVGDVPIIIGELHPGIKGGTLEGRPERLNAILHALAGELPDCAIASAGGLTLKADGLHFDSASCRTLGERYFEKYLSIVNR